MIPTLIDCDPGIDDSVAIFFALGSGVLDVRALTAVSGNLTSNICAQNACRILDLANRRDIPVAAGPMKPLVRPYPRDPFSHGSDGLGELDLPEASREPDDIFAPDLIIHEANRHNGELVILALGPLTNIALALIKDPLLPRKVKRLIIIGGSYGFQSNGSTRATGDNPASEWNVYVDPEAAKLVFEAGFNLSAVGLDVATHPSIELSQAHRAALASSGNAPSKFLLGVVDFVERRGFRSYCGLIDSIAVASAIDDTVLKYETVAVAIETQSPLSLGQTIVDRRDHFRWSNLPTVDAASEVNSERFFSLLIPSITSPVRNAKQN